MNIHAKQITALNLAVECIERERRTKYAAGEAAHRQGIKSDIINSDGIMGTAFDWVEDDHKSYERYTKAIQELEDLIDILNDPGVTYENNTDLPLFQKVG